MRNKYTVECRNFDACNWEAYVVKNAKEAQKFVRDIKTDLPWRNADLQHMRIRRNGWIVASWTRNFPEGVWHNSLLWVPLK